MIYIVVFVVSCFLLMLAEKSEKQEQKLLNLTITKEKRRILFVFFSSLGLLIPALLAGLRDPTIGTDVELYGNYWFEYTRKYSFIPYMEMANQQSIGLVYALLNYAVSFFSDDSKVFYFVLSLIETVLVYLGIRGFKDRISVPFAMFCYYTIFYNNSLNLLRQMLAVSIVIYAYRFLVKEQYAPAFILSVIATFTHSSAVFAIILIFYSKIIKKLNTKTDVIFFSAMLFSVIAVIMLTYKNFLQLMIGFHVLPERYLTYMEETVVGGRLIRFGFWAFIAGIAFVSFSEMINYDGRNKLLISCISTSLAFSLVMFMGNVYAIRMSYFFDIAAIFFIPMIPKVIKLRIDGVGEFKYLSYIVLVVLLVSRWYLEYVRSLNGETYPYQFASL